VISLARSVQIPASARNATSPLRKTDWDDWPGIVGEAGQFGESCRAALAYEGPEVIGPSFPLRCRRFL
jgi:hypothetical protein